MVDGIEIPEVHSFADILERVLAKAAGQRKRAALVWPDDGETLAGAMEARSRNLLEPVIIGDRQRIRLLLKKHDIKGGEIMILEAKDPCQAVETAIQRAQAQEIDLIIQGQVPMEEMTAALTSPESGFCQSGKIISHVAVMKLENYPKLLMLTDSAVWPEPDLSQKTCLIFNLVSVSRALGLDKPRIAIVAAVEAIYPHMPVTLDAAVLAKMAERGQIKGALVDGPLSYDVAIDVEAARAKGICHSSVAGQADAMVASSMEVANGVYLAMSFCGKCDIGGVIVGGLVPVAAKFPSDSSATRFNSILLALLLS